MIYFSSCKINIGLKIVNKRDDGFHNLETIFYEIPLYDVIEILPSPTFNFISTGLNIPQNGKDNLCVMAYKLLKNAFPKLPNVAIYLHKIIPAGAGLGGGSANAATVLKALNKQFNLGASQAQLLNMALQLGSDCPFFIYNGACIGKGRGEILTPVILPLQNYFIHIINPAIHINTSQAFAQINTNANINFYADTIINTPIKNWKNIVFNDFENGVFAQHPTIESIKNTLYAQGALYASMTGTGSTVYGIFKTEIPLYNWPKNYMQITKKLL